MLSCSLKFFFSYLVSIKLFPISLSNALTASFVMAAQYMPLYRYVRVHLSDPQSFGSSLGRFQFWCIYGVTTVLQNTS